MILDEFMTNPLVSSLMKEGLVTDEDVHDLWVSAVGDAPGLNEEEAFEVLCMVHDVPDPEMSKYLDGEFSKLTIKTSGLSYIQFLTWNDVQDMINEKIMTIEEITTIWRNVAGDLNANVDRSDFYHE